MDNSEYYMPTLNRELVEKHAGGRPSIYNQSYIDKTNQYIDNLKDSDTVIPSLVGLSLYLGIAEDTVQDWKNQKNKREFSVLCKHILALQHQALLENGLTGKFNAHITKLVLSNAHGYTDNANNNNNITINVSRDGVEINQEKTIEHEE